MLKIIKVIFWVILSVAVIAGLLMAGFIYKVKNGFPVSYETEAPKIDFQTGKPAILIFSKTTGFRHDESIVASKSVFAELAKKNNWFVFETEEGGVFNETQLAQFKVVVFNNSTGRVLNDDQQKALEQFVEKGGSLIGIHGSGDNSHHWDWYVQNLLGSEFSHHPISPQIQEANVVVGANADSLLTRDIPASWTHQEEWYVFNENPQNKGFQIQYGIDGEKIISNGNILWIKNKNFGMGKNHPVAWCKKTGAGKTFYTSLGHEGRTWKEANFLKLIENAVNWGMKN